VWEAVSEKALRNWSLLIDTISYTRKEGQKQFGGTHMVDIPLGLRQALESGDCVLFVGAGLGCHLQVTGSPIPDARALASDLATEFKIDVGTVTDLAKISQVVEIRKGRTELETYIKTRICNPEPDDTFRWISTVRWRAIFTTNYDNGVEQAYARTPNPPQTPVPIATTSQLTTFDRRFQVPLYYLHGTLCALLGNQPCMSRFASKYICF
jgi:hypothetical protein